MRNDKENIIMNKSIEFSLEIIDYCQHLKEQKHYEIASQLLRSGTSIGANVFEAQNGASQRDFINKMKISAKECDETKYWLILCDRSDHIDSPKKSLFEQQLAITKILSKIISSSKKRMRG